MPAPKGRVVGIGHASVDLVSVVPRFPGRGAATEMTEYSKQGGGRVATALVTCAYLGAETCYIGKLGDDELGQFILTGMRAARVDVSHVKIAPDRNSPLSIIVIDSPTRIRTAIYHNGDLPPLLRADVPLDVVTTSRILIVDGTQPEAQIAAAEAAREREVQVLLDANTLSEGMGELIALADVVIAGERFLSEVAPRGELEDSLAELTHMGPRTAVVTLGPSGSIGLEGNKLVRQAAFPVPAVDTTGAGSVYAGAFARALLDRMPLEKGMQFADAAAALSCRELGARAALPRIEEVLAACAAE
jgi:sugar/nucleoside kinase (ribokinase family)